MATDCDVNSAQIQSSRTHALCLRRHIASWPRCVLGESPCTTDNARTGCESGASCFAPAFTVTALTLGDGTETADSNSTIWCRYLQ